MLRASDYRERARLSLNGKWGMAVLVCFLGTLLGGITTGTPVAVTYNMEDGMGLNIFGVDAGTQSIPAELMALLTIFLGIAAVVAAVKFVVGSAVELGICAYFSKLALGMDADVKDEFAYFKYIGKAILLRIVIWIFTFLWALLFLIPGIVAAYRYSMATYIMAEHPDMGVLESIEASKRMMDGNKWSLFCLEFSFIGWMFLSALTLGIGDLFLTPYMQMAAAHFYMNISRGDAPDHTMNEEVF